MDTPFNLLDYPIAFRRPRRLTDVASWHMHIPFAFVITAMLKPDKFVELGTHKGDSYCAFCQAVDATALNTACCAVDSWQGDEHSGYYDDKVLGELQRYHGPLYGHFSTLVQRRFDDALASFPESSIDLLHIDGHHTYDSVRHDFESWLPKMSERGVMLLHDTNVRERDFGVWRLWREVAEQFPSFQFKFGHGLGVLAVGPRIPEEVQAFLAYGRENETRVTRFFYLLGIRNELDLQKARLSEQAHQLENALRDRDERLRQADEQRRQTDAVIAEKDRELGEIRNLLQESNRQLDEIHASLGWRLLMRLRRWNERGRI